MPSANQRCGQRIIVETHGRASHEHGRASKHVICRRGKYVYIKNNQQNMI
jgi:hypothetical protein